MGLTVSQWRAMTSEAGHGIQYFIDRTKYCLGFSDEDQICLNHGGLHKKKSSIVITLTFLTFCPKSIVFSKKSLHLKSVSNF